MILCQNFKLLIFSENERASHRQRKCLQTMYMTKWCIQKNITYCLKIRSHTTKFLKGQKMHTDIFPKAALEKTLNSISHWGNANKNQSKIPTRLTKKTAQQLLKKLHTDFPFHSPTVLPGIYPRETKAYVHTKPGTQTHRAVLFVTVKTESNPNVH